MKSASGDWPKARRSERLAVAGSRILPELDDTPDQLLQSRGAYGPRRCRQGAASARSIPMMRVRRGEGHRVMPSGSELVVGCSAGEELLGLHPPALSLVSPSSSPLEPPMTKMLSLFATSALAATATAQTSELYLTDFMDTHTYVVQNGQIVRQFSRTAWNDGPALVVQSTIRMYGQVWGGVGHEYDVNGISSPGSTRIPSTSTVSTGPPTELVTGPFRRTTPAWTTRFMKATASWDNIAVAFVPQRRSSGITYDYTDNTLWVTNKSTPALRSSPALRHERHPPRRVPRLDRWGRGGHRAGSGRSNAVDHRRVRHGGKPLSSTTRPAICCRPLPCQV
jgi:hypothetical protein